MPSVRHPADENLGGAEMSEHAVIVTLPAEQAVFDLDTIEDPLIAAIEASGIGEFDGNLIGPDSAILYMYAADADTLFEVIGPVLAGIDLPAGSYAVKRYGPPGAHETRVNLT